MHSVCSTCLCCQLADCHGPLLSVREVSEPIQAAKVQAPGRKRPRPQSGDAVQPKQEPEDQPASQRPRVEQQPVASVAGALPRAQDTDEPSGLATSGNAGGGAVSPPAESHGLTSSGAADTSKTSLADDQPGPNVFSPNAAIKVQDAEALQGSADADAPGKDGTAMVESTGTPGEVLDSSQRVEEHFHPSLPMQEMVVNFLLRMAFVIGGDRDHDLQVGKSVNSSSHSSRQARV